MKLYPAQRLTRPPAPGRNERCPCGSGKKYKHCCATADHNVRHSGSAVSEIQQQIARVTRQYERGRLAEAEEECRKALALYPGQPELSHLFGLVALQSGQAQAAFDALSVAARAAPANAIAHNHLGVACLALKRSQDALACFRQACVLDPQRQEIHNNLGICLKDLGELTEAEAAYREALRLNPDYAAALCNLGEIELLCGRSESACASLQRALQLDPRLVPAQLYLGKALSAQGRVAEAIEHLQAAAAANPGIAALHLNLGNALRESGRMEAAIGSYRTSLALRQDPEVHYNLGSVLLTLERADEAAASLASALAIKREFPLARRLLGLALSYQGYSDEAVEAYCAGGTGMTVSAAHLHLGCHLMGRGRLDHAALYLSKVVQTDPANAAAAHLDAALNGGNPSRASGAYVEQLFDIYAADFNDHLLQGLQYSAPRELARCIATFAGREPPWDVLDLGCGTGLVGAQLASRARSLIGVDLSANMLAQARKLNLYTRLDHADLVDAMSAMEPASFDVIAAADVLIYMGSLDEVASRVRALLRPGGLFAFSVEAASETSAPIRGQDTACGYRLTPTGRYVHSDDYLATVASLHGFVVRGVERTQLRLEGRQPVYGRLVLWSV
jgi:predicted TPR repeat methyltransferase